MKYVSFEEPGRYFGTLCGVQQTVLNAPRKQSPASRRTFQKSAVLRTGTLITGVGSECREGAPALREQPAGFPGPRMG